MPRRQAARVCAEGIADAMIAMAAEKLTLTGERETLLITLYGKAAESRMPDSLLHDSYAAAAVARIDYDFAKLKIDRDMMIGLAMRAHILDGWTRAFLDRHPDASVLHLGCGLDSRVFRIDPPPAVRWYDVDYPEVVALRRRLYPERPGYRLIGASVMDAHWLGEVPADRPAMVLAEGLLPYLPEEEVPLLLDRVTTHVASGEIAFDAYSRLGLRMIGAQRAIRATGAKLHWALDDPRDLERQVPRLTLLADVKAYDAEGYDQAQIARMSLPARLTIGVFRNVPLLARIGRLLRYGF